MKALMLAAGVGRRLFGDNNDDLPKALLRFEGQSLLERHIETLQFCNIEELVLVVGHRKQDLIAEALKVAHVGFIRWIDNPRYREGPILSLAAGEEVLRSGSDVLFMDSDVLFHPLLVVKLITSPHRTCFVVDREFQSNDDPVKVCLKDGIVVDFGKVIGEDHDMVGEWPGFMKMESCIAGLMMDAAQKIIDAEEIEGAYERVMKAVLKSELPETFGFVDVTNIPWVEIDYPSDFEKATDKVLPRISDYQAQLSDTQIIPDG